MGLIQAYEVCFQKYNKRTAQVLLTHDDITNRTRYLNALTLNPALVLYPGKLPVDAAIHALIFRQVNR